MLKIIWLSAALAWGAIRVYADRYPLQPDGLVVTVSEENLWGFGQVFPLFLVGLPLLAIFDVIQGKSSSSHLPMFDDQA